MTLLAIVSREMMKSLFLKYISLKFNQLLIQPEGELSMS